MRVRTDGHWVDVGIRLPQNPHPASVDLVCMFCGHSVNLAGHIEAFRDGGHIPTAVAETP